MKPEELKLFIERELDAISVKADMAKLPSITDAVIEARHKLNDKLKLAVVGKTKAGKSTLLNSLLGITELPTGDGIVTGNVSVLIHIDNSPYNQETVVVHLTDSSQMNVSLEQYRQLVDISKKDPLGIRDKIVWFDVYLKHQALLDMSIIDTPGDDSWLEYDSENAKALFRDKNRKPDIIAYVVRKEFGSKDIQTVQDYLAQVNGAEHRVSGLNVIAVYSCCDELVSSDIEGCNWELDYRIEGNRIIENNRAKSPAFRMCFSKCFPISAIFSMAANSLTNDDFVLLKEIAKSSISEYFYKDYSYIEIDDMKTMYPELFGIFKSDIMKDNMMRRLGLDAMKYIVWWSSVHPTGTIHSLRSDLENYSNVPMLRKYLLDEHFKKISLFYKTTSVLPELKKTIESEYNTAIDLESIANLRTILAMYRNIEKNIYTQYGFLSVLRDYYDCLDYFDQEDWDLAVKTIMYSISENSNDVETQEFRQQWQERMDFYNMIGNHFAVDASQKLINSVSSN
ncbi:dynamin family protein [Bacteroides congonensis]